MTVDDVSIPRDILTKIRATPPMICMKCFNGFEVEKIFRSGNLIAIKYKDSGYESDLGGFYCKACATELRQSRKLTTVLLRQ